MTAPQTDPVIALLERWHEEEVRLSLWGATSQCQVVKRCADELDAALRARDEQELTLQEAASLSGYSADRLGRLIRDGTILNIGRLHAPRIRRGDLPKRLSILRPAMLGSIDKAQIVRSVVTSHKENDDG